MKAYPVALRTRIVAAVDRGVGSLPTVAALFAVSTNCVANYLLLRAETGSLQPRPNPGGRAPAIGPERYEEVRQLLAAQPDLTLEQLRDALGLNCSLAAVCRTLKKLNLTRKKKTLHAAEQQRDDVQAAREEWVEWQAELTEADLARLVFCDEAAVLTNMTPRYGRSPRGERIVEYVPHGNWERLTIAAGIRLEGVCGSLAFEGGTTVEACATFAEKCLGPELRRGDIVIMDRLSSHSNAAVLEVFKGLGVTVKRLPAYSPDFNPIEKAWSKVKEAVRRARPRTADELLAAVGAALNAITPQDIRGWFTHCGYHTDS
jgi:transposase